MIDSGTGLWSHTMLDGDVALVTGAAQGIGRATAEQLAELGAAVVMIDANPETLGAAVEDLGSAGRRVVGVVGDVREESTFTDARDAAQDEFGASGSIFVSNAGITRDSSIRRLTREAWSEVIDIHLLGAFVGVQSVFADMVANKRGSIVLLSSSSANGSFGQLPYATAKAGLVGFAKTAAIEGGKYGVRVNAIAPGVVDTALVDAVPEEIRDSWRSTIPLRRFADPAEVARVIAFLSSPLASYITGALVPIDGGLTTGG